MIDLLLNAGATVGNGLVAILILGIVVFIHEAGHFLLAKWNNVGVLEFAIGMGKKLWSRRIGDTEYSLRLIPLGGFVWMIGDDPFFSPEECRDRLDSEQQKLLDHPQKWLISKGYMAKMAVVLAGPVFNILSALLISIFSLYVFGQVELIDKPLIGEVIPGFPASKAGLQSGDMVLSINDIVPQSWKELADTIAGSGGRSLELLVERRSEEKLEKKRIVVQGTLDSKELAVLEGDTPDKRYKIGIVPDVERQPASAGEAVVLGAKQVYFISAMTVRGLWGMVRGAISTKNIGGPLQILQAGAQKARKGFESLVDFVVLLSVSVAIFNLLPIPILDGGHLVFFTIEAIKGSPLNRRVQERARQVGMFFLLVLMLFAFGNDLQRILLGP